MFRDRSHAGELLARKVGRLNLGGAVVLAIPRGGVEVAVPIARELDGDLDVVLARKLRCPWQTELALGAVGEGGALAINPEFASLLRTDRPDIERECRLQLERIGAQATLFRANRRSAAVVGRDVVVVDDGLATGSTVRAALLAVKAMRPRRLVLAVPVAAPGGLERVSVLADEVVCLAEPQDFVSVGQYYDDFGQVTDARVREALDAASARAGDGGAGL